MNELSVLHNFTIESQVQYHAPLAYELSSVNSSENQMEYELGPDQLKTFVNSAEWTLGVITSATQWSLS
jgi:phosphatidylinositol glycan class S